MAEQRVVKNAVGGSAYTDPCGLIMPISATAAHDKAHWDAMLELLSRAVEQAGYTAKPVWIDSSTDRVSERIIGNIFDHSVVIADITDLNPNVMFELGLRLASKKPTLVVMEDGGSIPFDIRDFHIHIYPKNLSILGMEKFLNKLSEDIKAKKSAFENGNYTPFLSKVVVDVVSPNEREVSMNQFVLDQLNELNRRVARIDRPSRSRSSSNTESPDDLIVSSLSTRGAVFYADVALKESQSFADEAATVLDEVVEIDRDDKRVCYALVNKGATLGSEMKELRNSVENIIRSHKGLQHVPRHISERYSI